MRYHFLDNLRGLTFISMALYHLVWDLNNIFGVHMAWFASPIGHVWQQSILWTFVLLSGFCWNLGHHQAKRGIIVFAAGALVTAVTEVVMPEDAVVFGVLTFMGVAMLLVCPLDQYLKRLPALPAFIVCIVLFVLLRDVPFGHIGFEGLDIADLPGFLYANITTTFFGFQTADFNSSDYVPLLPWIFLYLVGYFAYRLVPRESSGEDAPASKPVLRLPQQKPWPVVDFVGRHSLEFYLVHQAVIYAVLYAIFAVIYQ